MADSGKGGSDCPPTHHSEKRFDLRKHHSKGAARMTHRCGIAWCGLHR